LHVGREWGGKRPAVNPWTAKRFSRKKAQKSQRFPIILFCASAPFCG
jgi:hypothetical protein